MELSGGGGGGGGGGYVVYTALFPGGGVRNMELKLGSGC